MYNDYYLLKRVKEEEGAVAYASVQDSFTYKGEVVAVPFYYQRHSAEDIRPSVGDKVLFLKSSGEDVQIDGVAFKVVKYEDLIMPVK